MRKYLLPGFLLILDILIIIASAIASVFIRFTSDAVDPYLSIIIANLPFQVVEYLMFFLFYELLRRGGYIWTSSRLSER